MSYPGGKGGDGVYQRIICQMPPHDVYIEPFLGGGSILKHKRLAACNIGIDVSAGVIAAFGEAVPGAVLRVGDGIEYLRSIRVSGRVLVYCDPPYLMSTRRSGPLYEYEMSDADHRRLLAVVTSLPENFMVMVSGYYSEMYADTLKDWRVITFQAMTHGGRPATEYLWMNYPEPKALHDYCYLGNGFRERERIKRKKARWVSRLKHMDSLERYALLDALEQADILSPIVASGTPAASAENGETGRRDSVSPEAADPGARRK